MVTRASRNDISLVTLERWTDAVVESARSLGTDVTVAVRKGLSLIAVISTSLDIPQVYESLVKERINIHAIGKATSGRSILVVVDSNDAERATRTLHDRLLPNT
jgi:aspartokinase